MGINMLGGANKNKKKQVAKKKVSPKKANKSRKMTECQKWKNDNPGKNCVAKKGSNQRLAVMNCNAYKTTGGLTKKDLTRNKQGKIVSKKASQKAKKGWKTLKKNPDFKENQK